MKHLYLPLLAFIIFSFSCQKPEEKEKPLAKYFGTYTIESKQINITWNPIEIVCYTGMDSLEIYIADSISASKPPKPRYYSDTTYVTETLVVYASPLSDKELVVTGVAKDKMPLDSLFFYNPLNTTTLKSLYNKKEEWILNTKYEGLSSLKSESEIVLDLKFDFGQYRYKTMTYQGTAKKLY